MFKRKASRKPPQEGVFAFVHLNARVMPDERETLFEQPLIEALAHQSAEQSGGRDPIAEVTGSGTMLDESGEVLGCGIDLALFDLDLGPEFVRAFLTSEGAPMGSFIEFETDGRKVKLPFGEVQGLAIFLNGTDLPDEVYQAADIDQLLNEVQTALQPDVGALWGVWEGEQETAWYCYGRSFGDMRARVAPILAKTPVCERCRVVQVA